MRLYWNLLFVCWWYRIESEGQRFLRLILERSLWISKFTVKLLNVLVAQIWALLFDLPLWATILGRFRVNILFLLINHNVTALVWKELILSLGQNNVHLNLFACQFWIVFLVVAVQPGLIGAFKDFFEHFSGNYWAILRQNCWIQLQLDVGGKAGRHAFLRRILVIIW